MIYPVILCGGAGTRLWPLSRKSFPKQFSSFIDPTTTLFEATLKRVQSKYFHPPFIVTGSDFRFIVAEQVQRADCKTSQILIEPSPKNTAPAILAAALVLEKKDPDAIILSMPSDHIIADTSAFHEAIQSGIEAVKSGKIITFGIKATSPETGYGWLEFNPILNDGAYPLMSFVEKPTLQNAIDMMKSENHYWNSGIFMFSASTIIEAFRKYAPKILSSVKNSVNNLQEDLDFLRLDPIFWETCPSDSIDYAIMEHTPNISVVPFSAGWSDLGSWNSVADELPSDINGVVGVGNITAINCKNSFLRSEEEGLELVGIGLSDIIAVAMSDAVLILDRRNAQDVKKAVAILSDRQARQASNFLSDHRPWGYFSSLVIGDRFQVKRIVVKPGAALSLQSHMHRSEHWIVVFGTALVTINDKVSLIGENESVYIPLGAKHRMENPGKVEMVLIEVQTGAYLEEDDIIRYEDIYARDKFIKV